MPTDEIDDQSDKGLGKSLNLDTHPLVAKNHPDPNELLEVVSLVGYLGPSNKSDNVRLYQDLTFQHYYEIPKSGIVSTSPLYPGEENSPTIADVKPDTKIQKVSIWSQNVEASFLRGAITGGYLGANTAAPTGVPSPYITLTTAVQCTLGGAVARGAQPQGNPVCDTTNTTVCRTCTDVAPVTHTKCVVPGPLCVTLNTHHPTWCAPCDPAVTTAATVCTQTGAAPPPPSAYCSAPGARAPVVCPTLYTAVPSACQQTGPCPTVYTIVPTWCG
jgi:hypothetical protein